MIYVAVDIGCIECGESSTLIGLFATRESAQAAADAAEEKQKENWTGQHHFEVFEAPEVQS